jgi:hypothetical protein
MTATGNVIKIGEIEVKDENGSVTKTEVVAAENTDKYSITVPAADKVKPEFVEQAGKKLEFEFSFGQVSDEDEAKDVCAAKGWDLVSFVNDTLKANAKAAAYQSKLNEFKLSEFNEEKATEDMVKNLMKLQKIDEATARGLVNALLGK